MKDGHPQEPGRRLNRLRGRGKAAAGAVGSDGIVLAPPLLNQHGRLRQRVEDLPVQQLVPELAVEALVVAVLPRAAAGCGEPCWFAAYLKKARRRRRVGPGAGREPTDGVQVDRSFSGNSDTSGSDSLLRQEWQIVQS